MHLRYLFVSVSVILITFCSFAVYGQNGYQSPVLDDDAQTTGAPSNTEAEPEKQGSVWGRFWPSKKSSAPAEDKNADQPQKPVKKSSWWKWGKSNTEEEETQPESQPANATPPVQNYRPPQTTASQQTQTPGNPSGIVRQAPAAQSATPSSTLPNETKPTAQADMQTPQYDWSQSRFNNMRAGNLPGQQAYQAYDGAKIIARVENAVILEGDIESGVKKRIAKLQRESKKNGATPPTENDLQQQIVQWKKEILGELIRRQVMFTKACAAIPQENLSNLKNLVDKTFDDKQIPTLIKEYDVASIWELEQALKAEGSSVDRERKIFFEQNVGQIWVHQQAEPAKEIRHDQIMDYYNDHIDNYTIQPKSRWEELVVFKSRFGSREEAYKAIQKMGQAVVAGKPFAEVAKESSQGFTASDGGKRDWVSPGALNSEPLNKALFEQPVGDLSPRIIEDDNCFYIVRVLERHGKKRVSFEEAQTEIRKILTTIQEEENNQKAYDKVFKDAKIWTIYDSEQPLN